MTIPLTTNPKSEMNLLWINTPPIIRLDKDKAALAIAELKKNMAGWEKVRVPEDGDIREDDINQRDWKDPKRTQQECWNDRIDSMNSMFEMKFNGDINFAYYVTGQPIGVMALTNYDEMPYIDDLVTHPGSSAAGGILIEYAVQISDSEWGKDGKLNLWALDDDAKMAYKSLGFKGRESDNDKDMILDPEQSTLWNKLDGKWQLKKFSGKKYVG